VYVIIICDPKKIKKKVKKKERERLNEPALSRERCYCTIERLIYRQLSFYSTILRASVFFYKKLNDEYTLVFFLFTFLLSESLTSNNRHLFLFPFLWFHRDVTESPKY
jgi:hypothetical protein